MFFPAHRSCAARAILALAVLIGSAVAGAGTARAEPRPPAAEPAPGSDVQAPRCLVIPVDASQAALSESSPHRSAKPPVLFLNRCRGGTIYVPGFEDSRTDTSSIIPFPGMLTEFPLDDDAWDEVVAETRDIFGGYDLVITDVDPGDQPHHEVAVCGAAEQIGFDPATVGGVSPLRCRPIENSIAFVFPPSFGNRTRRLAETVAHEAGHSFGLDHEYLCDEIMSYQDCYPQYFRDQAAPCGTYQVSDCACPRQAQNTHEFLLQAFGPSVPTPPQVLITGPEEGASVELGFWVLTEISDLEVITSAWLRIDGRTRLSLSEPPYYFKTPVDLGAGRHYVEVTAVDRLGIEGSAMVSVTLGEACGDPRPCPTDQVCVDGRCVLGPGQTGGLGEPCGDVCPDTSCVGADSDAVCVAFCVDGGCPAGFACRPVESLGRGCLRIDSGGGGCAATAPVSPWPGLLLLLFGLMTRCRRGAPARRP